MAKYDIPIDDYLSDLSIDQLAYIRDKAIKRLTDIKSEGVTSILMVESNLQNTRDTKYFHLYEMDKAMKQIHEWVSQDLDLKEPRYVNYTIHVIRNIYFEELKDYGLEKPSEVQP